MTLNVVVVHNTHRNEAAVGMSNAIEVRDALELVVKAEWGEATAVKLMGHVNNYFASTGIGPS